MGAPVHGVLVGLATLDVIHLVDADPGANGKVTALQQFVAAGGPAANAAVTFAALGGRATLVTALGRGAVADAVRADLVAHGVEVVDVTPDAVDAAPVSAIRVSAATGDRAVVSVDATAGAVPTETAVRVALTVTDSADVVLVDGHHPSLALAAARRAAFAGIPLVVDAGRWKDVFGALLPCRPEFVCSADLRAPGTSDLAASAAALRARGVDPLVVTRGADPVLWWDGRHHGEVDVPRVRAVDTLGAGDVFHGAYAHARAHGHSVPLAVAAGVGVAARKVTVPGPRAWLIGQAGRTGE